jgi:hypothetical protein
MAARFPACVLVRSAASITEAKRADFPLVAGQAWAVVSMVAGVSTEEEVTDENHPGDSDDTQDEQ